MPTSENPLNWIALRTPWYPGEGISDSHPKAGTLDYLLVESRGCGCCSNKTILTPETLDEAKAEARSWLAALESIDPSTL